MRWLPPCQRAGTPLGVKARACVANASSRANRDPTHHVARLGKGSHARAAQRRLHALAGWCAGSGAGERDPADAPVRSEHEARRGSSREPSDTRARNPEHAADSRLHGAARGAIRDGRRGRSGGRAQSRAFFRRFRGANPLALAGCGDLVLEDHWLRRAFGDARALGLERSRGWGGGLGGCCDLLGWSGRNRSGRRCQLRRRWGRSGLGRRRKAWFLERGGYFPLLR